MLNLGSGAAAPAENLITDGSQETFMQDVIEASKQTPVIVDFWAPWCGPCKSLGPAIEAEVTAAGGKVKLVKIDIDQNQMLAGQMQIQSIPAVYAFVDGKPVDGFMGNQPPSEIKKFVEKIAAQAPEEDNGLDDAVAAGEEMLEAGAAADAAPAPTPVWSRPIWPPASAIRPRDCWPTPPRRWPTTLFWPV
jgi:putative thioredoxin